MKEHIKILGILNIVMGGLTALLGLFILLAMGGIAGIVALTQEGSDATVAAPIVAIIGGLAGAFFVAISLPSIIGGWGLLHYKRWSRIEVIIVSGFHLLHVPFGTALGVYGLWVLCNEQSRLLFESGGVLPPPAAPYTMPQQPAGFRPQGY